MPSPWPHEAGTRPTVDTVDPFAAARASLAARLARERAEAGAQLSLDEVVAGVAELRPLPAVALRILELGERGQFAAHELASLIASDQALTARMLRLANSAYYGFARRITTVRDAVVLLGFRTVRQAALAASMIASSTEARRGALDYDAFWQFSIATAMLAEVLARTEGRHQDEAFTAGVLHQVGLLAIDQFRPEMLGGVRERMAEGSDAAEAERSTWGFSRAELAGALGDHWGLPNDLVAAIRDWERPLDALAQADNLAGFIARARLLVRSHGLSDGLAAVAPQDVPAEWQSGALGTSLRQAGGMSEILSRVDAFLDASGG